MKLSTIFSPYRYGDPFCAKHECLAYSCFSHIMMDGDLWYFRHYLN